MSAVLALRTKRGIDWREFAARYGKNYADSIRRDLANFPPDLVANGDTRTSLTPKGLRLGNSIWAEII
jgi:coproporphyrinogen III oxidase-like Fe-S oxidoreductase